VRDPDWRQGVRGVSQRRCGALQVLPRPQCLPGHGPGVWKTLKRSRKMKKMGRNCYKNHRKNDEKSIQKALPGKKKKQQPRLKTQTSVFLLLECSIQFNWTRNPTKNHLFLFFLFPKTKTQKKKTFSRSFGPSSIFFFFFFSGHFGKKHQNQ
jgi:hypothetical protein